MLDNDKLVKLSAIIGLIAIILEIVGLITRGWIRFKHVIHVGDFKFTFMGVVIPYVGLPIERSMIVEFGLWTVSICMNGVCATVRKGDWWSDVDVQRYSELLDVDRYQVVSLLAIGIGGFSLLFLVLHIRRPVLVNKSYGLLSLAGFVISGSLLWYVVGKFAKLATNLHPTLTRLDDLTAMTPYSVVLVAIGALLSFISATLTFAEVFRTGCISDGGIIINKYPSVPHNTLVNINHQVHHVPPPMPTQTTHVGITVHK